MTSVPSSSELEIACARAWEATKWNPEAPDFAHEHVWGEELPDRCDAQWIDYFRKIVAASISQPEGGDR